MMRATESMARMVRLGLCGWLAAMTSVRVAGAGEPPAVTNVTAVQRGGTKLMDIRYDVSDPDSASLTVMIRISTNDGVTFDVPVNTLTNGNPAVVSFGEGVTPGTNRWVVWDGGADWNRKLSDQVRVKVMAADPPPGMVPIPGGTFQMGDSFGEGRSDERPVHTVRVNAFLMDKYEVTKAKWDEVATWAAGHGYDISVADGSGKAANHPVQTVTWYSCVKWCNARSEKEGLTPSYYLDADWTQVYRTGSSDISNDKVYWVGSGYRLPTEAEWEYAARGGVAGKRFPWADADTISHSRANYYAAGAEAYDLNYGLGYHDTYETGGQPCTSPVGSFAGNGYELYDMAGNAWEWCWDWYESSYYGSSPGVDPRGASSGSYRVVRGGSWNNYATYCRVGNRFKNSAGTGTGFRTVLPPGQQ